MNVSDELFYLIQRLTGNEKRHFRRLVELNDKHSQVLRLYDFIRGADGNPEEEIREWYRAIYPQDHASKLSDHKKHLRKLILQAMRTYPSSNTLTAELQSQLQDVVFLLGKELYIWSARILRKVKAAARKHEEYSILLEALRYERRLLKARQLPEYDAEVEQLLLEGRQTLDKLQAIHTAETLNDRLLIITHRRSSQRSRAELALLEEVQGDEEADKGSFRLNWLHWYGKALCAGICEDPTSQRGYFRKIVELWEKYPHFIKADAARYKLAISNYLNSCHALGDYSAYAVYIDKIRNIPDRSPDQKAESFINASFLEVLRYLNEPDIGRGLQRIGEIEEELARYHRLIKNSRRLAFYENVMLFYFVAGKLDKAYTWNEKIHGLGSTGLREDIHRLAHLMRPVLDHETQSTHLANTIRRTKRALSQVGGLNPFEQLLLRFLSRAGGLRQKEFRAFSQEMDALAQEGTPLYPGFREIRCWVQAKARRVSMELIIREEKGT